MERKHAIGIGGGLVIIGLIALLGTSCIQSVRRGLVTAFTPEYTPEGDPSSIEPVKGSDTVSIDLEEVAQGYENPTDIQFVPGAPDLMVVLEQSGRASWRSLKGGSRGDILSVEVLTDGEQGLLGLAFHPRFEESGRFFINTTVAAPEGEITRVDEWSIGAGKDIRTATAAFVKTLLGVPQPYQNHNAGQLAFGPDGMLYIGLGDGGFADDPHAHGQNTATLLGSMLRIDVDKMDEGKPYAVPPDNPLVKGGVWPEIWAWGLRNPWRYSFADDGRAIVADVGQDTLEEVTIVGRGENHGWKIREGDRCFEPEEGCKTEGLVEPAFVYPREEGYSITGGYVYKGALVPELKDLYVFGDFISGRMWAIEVPEGVGQKTERVAALGKWPILVSTFGRDAAGEVYVADYGSGKIYRIVSGQ